MLILVSRLKVSTYRCLVRAASRVGYLRVAVHLHAEANVEVPGLEALLDHVPRKDVEPVLLALGDDTGDGTSSKSCTDWGQGSSSEDITSCFFSSSHR